MDVASDRVHAGLDRLRGFIAGSRAEVQQVLARLEPQLRGRAVQVSLPDAILQVPIEATLVEQVLINLLENALKYTPSGSPIEITARAADGDVLVEVADRGPGIPPGKEERIFDKYYRAAPTGKAGGAGLGLAVCRAAVEAHGGRILAVNREGGGAAFRFTLPVEGTPPAVEAVPEPRPDSFS